MDQEKNDAYRAWESFAAARLENLQDTERHVEERARLREQNASLEEDVHVKTALFNEARALLERAYTEMAHRHGRCPSDDDIFVAPHGNVWHLVPDCQGLQQARRVSTRRACTFCATSSIPSNVRHGLTGTTFAEDEADFHRRTEQVFMS